MLVPTKREASHLPRSRAKQRPMSKPCNARPEAVPVKLSTLSSGLTARLHAAELAPADCDMLRALGMTDECTLRICKVGEPCIVQVQSTRIGLSRAVADGILVGPDSEG